MPIDYKRYPPNWLTEIRPRILKRANNQCEQPNCDFKHLEEVWAVKHKGKTIGWFRDYDEATPNIVKSPPKKLKVILTIAHLDHDEENLNISDDRLKAMCQLCHLRYDAKEKYRRATKQIILDPDSIKQMMQENL
jgi:hypothetical protein